MQSMEEAFRRALDEAEKEHEAPHLGRGSLRVLEARCAPQTPASHCVRSEESRARLVYAARKLLRRWCSSVKLVCGRQRAVDEIRDDWAILANQLTALSHGERVQILAEMVAATCPGD